MFTSDSRYRRSRVVTAANRAGQPIQAAELRLPPPTAGSFLHAVEEGERIDGLAHKFYRDPRQWWRITDANPAFSTPEQLLGQSPLITELIALVAPTAPAPWAQALAAGAALPGVIGLLRQQTPRLEIEVQIVLGEPIEIVTEQIDEAVLVTYNGLVLDPAALLAIFTSLGFIVAGRETISQVGQPIVIPPGGGP